MDPQDRKSVYTKTWCISTIFTLGLICLFLWLGLRTQNPNCTLDYFYIPALNKTLNSQDNTTLIFVVRFSNPNIDKGIYYDDVHLSFSNTTSSVANYTVPSFYQGHHKTANKVGLLLPNGSAVFRVDLKTKIRFKIVSSKTKRYGIDVGANVEVNGNGTKTQMVGIRMKKSDSSFPLRSYFHVSVLVNLIVFFAIC